MAEFGIETEDDARKAVEIANIIQRAIPEGSMGGHVMMAMALLIGTGAKICMPPDDHEMVVEDASSVIRDVLNGRIDANLRAGH